MAVSFFRSSVDPRKVALTIKGLAVFVPTAIVFLKYFNVNVGVEDVNNLIDALANVVVIVGTLVSAVMVVYGFGRKVFYAVFDK